MAKNFNLDAVVAESFLQEVSARFPGSMLYHDQQVGMVLVRNQDFAQGCEAGVKLADRDHDGFVCVRVDHPTDCTGGRIVWYRRWDDEDTEKLAEFFREVANENFGDSWKEFCETWDRAQAEARLVPDPISQEAFNEILEVYKDQKDRFEHFLLERGPDETWADWCEAWDFAQEDAKRFNLRMGLNEDGSRKDD